MKTKRNINTVIGEPIKVGLLGGGIAILAAMLLAGIAAACMDRGILAQEYVLASASVLRMLSIFIGVALAGGIVKEKKIQTALVSLGSFLFVLVCGTVLFWDGMFDSLLLGLLGCILSGAAGVAVNMIPKKGGRGMRVHRRYR